MTSFTTKPEQHENAATKHETVPRDDSENTLVAKKPQSKTDAGKLGHRYPKRNIPHTGVVELAARRYDYFKPDETTFSEESVHKAVESIVESSDSVFEPTRRENQLLDELSLSIAMTEQCDIIHTPNENLEGIAGATTDIGEISTPNSERSLDAAVISSAKDSTNEPLYCSKCFEEHADDNEPATKICHTCGGMAFCNDCFTFFHKKKKKKDHLVLNIDQTICSNGKDDTGTRPQRLAHSSVQRLTSLNARDSELQQTLAKTGKPLLPVEPALFQFMRVVEDEGDSGMVVDKVINVQEEILRFCKVVNVNSCSFSDPSTISFKDLDHNRVTVTGMYGETSYLLQFLTENLHMNSEAVSLLSASGSKFSSGVYAFLPNAESMFLFYWSKEISQNQYSSSSISCQCIRYLQRLCHSIVVLFGPDSLDSKQLNRVKHQQQAYYADMEVLQVVDYEEGVTLLPGFKVDAPSSFAEPKSEPSTDLAFSSGKEGFIVGFPKRVGRKLFTKSMNSKVSETYYKEKFSQHIQTYHVDCSAIVEDDKQLRLFLRLTFPSCYKFWSDSENKFRNIAASLKAELSKVRSTVAEEHERLCKLWEEGVSYLFSELCPNEENAFVMQKSHHKSTTEQRLKQEPLLVEPFGRMRRFIAEAAAELRRKGALADVLLEMDPRYEYSLGNSLQTDLFPREVNYRDALQRLTSQHFFRRLYNFLTKQGIDTRDLERKVSAKLKKSLLPTHSFVLEKFKVAYNRNIRQYFRSPDRAEIPSVEEMVRAKTEELKRQASHDRTNSSFETYRENLRTEGINVNSSQFKFRVKSFQAEKMQITIDYEEENLEKEEVAYEVYQLQINQKDLEQMQKETKFSVRVRPSLRWIEGAYVHLKKDDEQLRGLYWVQRQKKVIALVYSEVEKRLSVYAGNWKNLTKSRVRFFPRDCDAHAFDGERHLLALSNNAEKIIALFQLTDCYTQLIRCEYSSRHEIGLSDLCPPSFVVKQLCFFDGEYEILLVGSTLQGYVYDMKRSRLLATCYNFDRDMQHVFTIPGYILEVAGPLHDHSSLSGQFVLNVHSKTSRELLNAIPLPDVNAHNVKYIQLLDLGLQAHLLVPLGNGQVKSFVIEATVPESRIRFDSKQARSSSSDVAEAQEGNPLLECFYKIFYKYPIRNCYETEIPPLVLFCVHPNSSSDLEGKVRCYMGNLLQELEEETGKATGPLLEHMEIVTCTKEDCSKLMWRSWTPTAIGLWTRELISAVPIQIARAEDDRLLPLSKGMNLNLNFDFSSADMADVINAISFGLHESIFKTADVPIKVLSAKGRQSVGKSYLLNHVAGAQFDIEGGRCTHGVWMTVKLLPNMILVVLDFEGLGSFDRTRQEDVLLSVFGAAVSNLTVFKTDCRFDRDTEVMFDRLQDGAKLLKSGERNKLFKGKLAIVVRDVSKSAAKATIEEFFAKIKLVCQAHSTSNFVCNLYDGMCRVATSQPMGSSQFLQSFEQVKEDLNKQPPVYDNPVELMGLLKTVLAKIYLQDWSPIDRTRVVQKVRQLDRILSDAAMFGALVYNPAANSYEDFEPLCKLGSNTSETIPDEGSLPDTGLQLLPAQDDENIPELRDNMIAKFRDSKMLAGLEIGSKEWLTNLSDCFNEIACRRIQRVQKWIHLNTEGYTDDEEVQQLMRKAESDYFRPLRQVWSVCGEKCESCNRLCVKPEYHKRNTADEQHSCGTDHLCSSNCSFCKEEEVSCGYVALHSGDHHCKLQSHTCRKPCHLDILPGCNGFCSLPSDHLQKRPGSRHICDAGTHYCGKKCDLNVCKNNCYYPHNVEHTRHKCNSSSGCPLTCIMECCSTVCCSTDHFHSLDHPHDNHFCDQPHPCTYPCGQDGLCGIDVQLVSVRPSKTLQKFQGRRGIYEYQLFSEQIMVKKPCGILIPRGMFHHEGPHVHTGPRGESLPKHFCDKQCEGCLRYCEKGYGHSGRHSTTHGNMSRHVFVSSERSFNVGDREYERGESAIAELCDQFCKRRGRGHTHVVVCQDPSTCTSSSHRRHNQHIQVEENHKDHILDVVTHDFYWKEMDFEDPCTRTEQENFRMCNMVCERATVEGASPLPEDSGSPYFCQLPLWHKQFLLSTKVECGHLSVHGHHFYCTHELKYQYHTVLIIDQSGSMANSDDMPEDELLLRKEHLQNRLGAVLAACHAFVESRYRCSDGDRYSLVTFSASANLVVSGEKVSDGLILSLAKMDLEPDGTTYFANALILAKDIINEVARCYPSLSPLVIMLSDGMAHDHDLALSAARSLISGCPKTKDQPIIHTIKFGCDTNGNRLLQKLAEVGKGEMHLAQDRFELAEKFREFNELMTQGAVGTIRNIPPRSTGLLDKEGESWFPQDVSASEYGSVSLHMLESGNAMYQICGRRCLSGKADQQNRIRPLNLCDTGTIGNSLSVVFSIRHMGQMYHLKCLYHKKVVEEEAAVIVKSSELDCLKQLGTHKNIETIRHSFDDRADIAFPWLDDECKLQAIACSRASFIVVDSYDQTLGELFSQGTANRLLAEDITIDLKSLVMITLQLSSALSHLALKGIIHGSVMENNIYMRTPTEPVLCNFERSFSTGNIAAVRKAVSAKQRELGVTCTAAPELAVQPDLLSVDSSIRPSIIGQVKKIDIFGLGVTMYNHLLPTCWPKFPTKRPFVENTLPNLCKTVGTQISQLLFSMVRRDPELRISADESLLACQLMLSNLNLEQGVATERHFNHWLKKKKKVYVPDETLESELTKEFLDKANYRDVLQAALLLKVSCIEESSIHIIYIVYHMVLLCRETCKNQRAQPCASSAVVGRVLLDTLQT